MSRQINFYFTNEDATKVDAYIKQQGLLIACSTSLVNSLDFTDSILVKEKNGRKLGSQKYILFPQDVTAVSLDKIDSLNQYSINVLDSPVLEIFFPSIDTENFIILRGRFYYTKSYFDKLGNSTLKSKDFLKMADQFFKWIKKNFPNTKLSGFEDFLVTESTTEWLAQTGGTLLLNNTNAERDAAIKSRKTNMLISA